MNLPVANLYSKFGDPYRVVEFRAFLFNSCQSGCSHCYYQKTNNNFYDFEAAEKLALDFSKNHYTLETFYLLPTDVFENDFNYGVFKNDGFKQVAKLFNYIGLASALRKGYDDEFFTYFFATYPDLKIELHINLIESQIENELYVKALERNLSELRKKYEDKILINLALNVGSSLSADQMDRIKNLVSKYSQDRILELNFTFMFNEKISKSEKSRMLKSSYPILQYFGNEFKKTERAYNNRTLLRKPSITFKNNKIFLSPIIPFDEYIFMDQPEFRLEKADFTSFLSAHCRIEEKNMPKSDYCMSCDNFDICYGKGFFSIANFYDLPCLQECGDLNGFNYRR